MIVFTFNGILETESVVLMHHGQNDTRRQRLQGYVKVVEEATSIGSFETYVDAKGSISLKGSK